MKYEYYYLFGLDIPLDKYRLGVIKQPKLIDYISKEIDIETFYLPFIMNDIIISQTDDKESLMKIKKTIGSLSFILMNCYQSKRFDVINSLIESLKILYDNYIKKDSIPAAVKGDVVEKNGYIQYAIKQGQFSTAKIGQYINLRFCNFRGLSSF